MEIRSATAWASMRSRIAAGLLGIAGILVMAMGVYFAILRPAFLPEDLRFIGTEAKGLTVASGITSWLRLVFVVLGAYAFTTGLFTSYVAFAAFLSGGKMPVPLIALAGLTSIGVMVAVNFVIGSEFKYLLAGLGALWAISVVLDLPWPTSKKEIAKAHGMNGSNPISSPPV